ncbi:MAG: DUF3164 family protein [Kiritimatiellae bacterium]|nr:DUF3164 family protein [Kiritimatiellia bacterium]
MKQKLYTDSQGNTVPAKYVSDYDKKKDAAARAIEAEWRKAEAALAKVWQNTLSRVAKVRQAAEKRERIALGLKGNFSFFSFDGRIQVRHDSAADVVYDERLSLAKDLLAEAIEELAGKASGDLKAIVEAAFRPRGKQRALDRSRLHDICKLNVRHPKWLKAVELIKAAETERGRREYLSVAVDGKRIVLDIQRNGRQWARNAEGGAE